MQLGKGAGCKKLSFNTCDFYNRSSGYKSRLKVSSRPTLCTKTKQIEILVS